MGVDGRAARHGRKEVYFVAVSFILAFLPLTLVLAAVVVIAAAVADADSAFVVIIIVSFGFLSHSLGLPSLVVFPCPLSPL